MKNIQVIDGATNCAYSVYEVNDEDFQEIFPGPSQDIEFVGDFFDRVGDKRATEILNRAWPKRVEKAQIKGLHGTLFYELEHKKKIYPNKRESDLDEADYQKSIR